jgi:hypothetical protein
VTCDSNALVKEVNIADSRKLRAEYDALLAKLGLDLPFADAAPTRLPDPFAGGSPTIEGMRRAIRFLESGKGYMDWPGVGTEPKPVFLYRLGTVRAREGPYLARPLASLQDLLGRQAAQLLGALKDAGKELPFPIFVGIYPTGEFNARVRPAGDGALLLINAGLMDLIFSVLKINLASSFDPGKKPLLEEWQAAMVLAESFNAYLYGGGSMKAWPLPRLNRGRESVLGYVLHAAEAFAVAHEIGHVVLGHVHLSGPPAARASVQLTPETELAADAFAVDLVASAMGVSKSDDHAPFLGGGMLTVLAIAVALDVLSKTEGIDVPIAGTHPALGDRWAHLTALLEERFPATDATERGTIFFNWLNRRFVPDIIQWFREVSANVRRPGQWELPL